MLKPISCGLLGLSAAFVVVAASFAIRDGSSSFPQCLVEGTDQDLGDISVGRHELALTIVNRSGRPLRVLGMTPACGNNCCFEVEHWSHVTVAPHESHRYRYGVWVHKPGPFQAETTIYLDEDAKQSVRLKVRGTAIVPQNAIGDLKPEPQ